MNILRKIRKENRLTQEAIGQKVGLTRQSIISIELGRTEPSLKTAYKLAKVFGMTIEELFFADKGKGKR